MSVCRRASVPVYECAGARACMYVQTCMCAFVPVVFADVFDVVAVVFAVVGVVVVVIVAVGGVVVIVAFVPVISVVVVSTIVVGFHGHSLIFIDVH